MTGSHLCYLLHNIHMSLRTQLRTSSCCIYFFVKPSYTSLQIWCRHILLQLQWNKLVYVCEQTLYIFYMNYTILQYLIIITICSAVGVICASIGIITCSYVGTISCSSCSIRSSVGYCSSFGCCSNCGIYSVIFINLFNKSRNAVYYTTQKKCYGCEIYYLL